VWRNRQRRTSSDLIDIASSGRNATARPPPRPMTSPRNAHDDPRGHCPDPRHQPGIDNTRTDRVSKERHSGTKALHLDHPQQACAGAACGSLIVRRVTPTCTVPHIFPCSIPDKVVILEKRHNMQPFPFTNVPCPKCKANIGHPCRSASGLEIPVGHSHVDRARAFGRKFPKPAPENWEPAIKRS